MRCVSSSWRSPVRMLFAVMLLWLGAARAESDDAVVCEASSSPRALFCSEGDCLSESDCWSLCPIARSVFCNASNVCEFDVGGGGGGGGGDPVCEMQECSEDRHCVCNGRPGSCGPDFLCYY
ncbi:hypothetical protein OWM54_14090 [Myxococcus sp. MISCRS1]|jgi:hypothetical protein|uniref:hypothetical protein n=1 Tax=Myxococcus sp. MISCRS1 TaxID=2996786 RepID=UPI001DE2BAED|nr:hypothetical protein [Myxococcus sp. MISCRS1]MBZ4407820.1 hypothetical protein [Myxococcus sp. XM-1-1-1]MCY0998261.1 hypothetical protein [Myxococcus sp. MISCRS1]